ncbi:MAG: hypothetical protein MI725_10755, partial [Pirellulales bacterium]|nr:hypothetical protein [Pirellulales bacterium]
MGLALVWAAQPTVSYAQGDEEGNEAVVEQDVAGAENLAGREISYLSWAASSLGWFYGLVFLGLSFTLVA